MKGKEKGEVGKGRVEGDGNEITTYSEATDIEPGERVRYALAYTNEGVDTAEDVSLVMPVPSAVTYVEGSAVGTVEFSADNGRTYASREALLVGSGEFARMATSEEITHIKWAIPEPIAPAATGTISFEAVLK